MSELGVACSYKETLFPLCDEISVNDLVVTAQGLYSVTPAVHNRSLCDSLNLLLCKPAGRLLHVVDMTACIGGDTLGFASAGLQVTAFETQESQARALRHNISLYPQRIQERITVYSESSVTCNPDFPFSDRLTRVGPIDILYFDPPWGGENYVELMKEPNYDLYLECEGQSISLQELVAAALRRFSTLQVVVCKVPSGFSFDILEADREVSHFKKYDILMFYP